jgi:hypothetical protein
MGRCVDAERPDRSSPLPPSRGPVPQLGSTRKKPIGRLQATHICFGNAKVFDYVCNGEVSCRKVLCRQVSCRVVSEGDVVEAGAMLAVRHAKVYNQYD